jgi:hypothetical protein
VHPEPERLLHRRDLRCDVDALARVHASGRGDHRVRGRILRLQPCRPLGARGPHQIGAQQLHLPVGREAKPHQLGRGEQVHRGPGLGLEADELELDGQCGRRVDRGVDAGHVRRRERHHSRVHRARLALRHAPQPERPHQAVGWEGFGTGELRQAAGCCAAEELELPQPVLPVAEPQREADIVRRARGDVGDTEPVAQDLQGRIHAAQLQAARGLG